MLPTKGKIYNTDCRNIIHTEDRVQTLGLSVLKELNVAVQLSSFRGQVYKDKGFMNKDWGAFNCFVHTAHLN